MSGPDSSGISQPTDYCRNPYLVNGYFKLIFDNCSDKQNKNKHASDQISQMLQRDNDSMIQKHTLINCGQQNICGAPMSTVCH